MTAKPPKIADAPGLTWRIRANGWEARWRPRTDLVKRGYPANVYRLWLGWEPDDEDKKFISDRCHAAQGEMLNWARGGIPIIGGMDGTLKGLIQSYLTDADSPYRTKRYKTRTNYDNLTARIVRDHGAELLRDIKARMIKRWHEDWSAGGKITMAHNLIGMLRTVLTFGATILEDKECQRIKAYLGDMRFEMGRSRKERLTAKQAIAIRSAAHQQGLPSIALAQALQFELMLRQKDVIGEWVPMGEPDKSEITYGNEKWVRGLRWSSIDQNLILRHTTSKRNKPIEVDLRLAPMVMEELQLWSARSGGQFWPSSGPVIVYEATEIPYIAHQFRREWRKLADLCGVPKEVFNMDSRAGAISEATDAGADLEHVRHAATHSNIQTTQGYSRGGVEKVAGVMQKRVEHRNKK